MPSLKDLANTVSSFNYYSGIGNFTARDLPYGDEKPLVTTAVGARWSPSNFDDGLVPFGVVTRASRTAADLFRIGKWLSTSVKGPLFVVKQIALQKSNPNIEFAAENDRRFGPTRTYSPLPLLAQIPANLVGARLMRHGFFPEFSDTSAYQKYVYDKDRNSQGADNRLIKLYTKLSDITSAESKGNYVLSYRGGPGAFYGIGRTTIARYGNILTSQPTNKNLADYVDLYGVPYTKGDDLLPLLAIQLSDIRSIQSQSRKVLQYKYQKYNAQEISIDEIGRYGEILLGNNTEGVRSLSPLYYITANKIAGSGISNPKTNFLIDPTKPALDPNNPNAPSNFKTLSQTYDFRAYKNLLPGNSVRLATGSYEEYNLEDRIGIATARKDNQRQGDSATSSGYTIGKRNNHDNVNFLSLFAGTSISDLTTEDVNGNLISISPSSETAVSIRDMIKFRIKIIDNEKAPNGVYIVFRSYINNIKRSMTPKWSPHNYVGRGESFYAYDGFTETISISFTVAVSSRIEMRSMYQKLNYLISSLAPDYSKDGKMRGNIAELTVGNFLLYQPGVITGLDMTIDEDSTWEIALSEPEDGEDNDMHELPHLIKCSMSFIPIYNFLPKKGFQSPFIGIDNFPGIKEGQRWLKGDKNSPI
jgi:hypothetical protein